MPVVKRFDAADDPFDLNRFIQAQEADYDQALSELKSGRKRTHWMWYIFPQISGLGFSEMSQRYSIKSVEEAHAYLNHTVLGSRLRECAEAVMRIDGCSAKEIFGSPDDLKLKSCATLFASIESDGSSFHQILVKYYDSARDDQTLRRLGTM